jgi:hypothetical protein
MRYPEDKIKEAILHPDIEIRDRAVRYFAQSFSTDTSLMPLVIKAVEAYGRPNDAYRLIGASRELPQTEDTIAWIIDELNAGPTATFVVPRLAAERIARLVGAVPRYPRRHRPDGTGRHRPADRRQQEDGHAGGSSAHGVGFTRRGVPWQPPARPVRLPRPAAGEGRFLGAKLLTPYQVTIRRPNRCQARVTHPIRDQKRGLLLAQRPRRQKIIDAGHFRRDNRLRTSDLPKLGFSDFTSAV